MKLVLAQGNAEPRFDGTRHNVGFMIIDAWAKLHQAEWVNRPKFRSIMAEVVIEGEKVILVKPTTYYNETGYAARKLVDFYKLDTLKDLLVIHDDLALNLGTIRVRGKGSDAGNNGIKSLNSYLGDGYQRLRIGIMNDQHFNDIDFVLGRFNQADQIKLQSITDRAIDYIDQFIDNQLVPTSEKV